MKKNNNLVLLTDSYPYGIGELFLDIEVEILSRSFETIYVYSLAEDRTIQRPFPSNVTLWSSSKISLKKSIKYSARAICFKELWEDFFAIKSRFKQTPSWLHFKILMADYIKAANIANDLSHYYNKFTINTDATIFYSYWHDPKALALALLKSEKPIKSVARAHGWDIDYPRHKPAYLPWKNFILTHLDKTVSISDYGLMRLREVTDIAYHSKLVKFHLGKSNSHSPILNKASNEVLIGSCSSLIPLKRVDVMIKVLAKLKLGLVHWVHFGDGPLRLELENLVDKYEVSFEFQGNVSNGEILKYYAENYVDIFINLSSSEGIPVSIMEAQSAGIPVLALDVGGCSEIVNNENGFLLPKEATSSEIAKTISNYILSPSADKEKKRKRSYENWIEKFNAEKNYMEFTEMLIHL